MTRELPSTRRGSCWQDGSESDKHNASPLQQDNGDLNTDVGLVTGNQSLRAMDDVEGVVLELLDEIAAASARESMEKSCSGRLFGVVADWGVSILSEALNSALALTGDAGVDSHDVNFLNHFRVLLGRSHLPSEKLVPPTSCPLDTSYQRRQVPIRTPKRTYYDSQGLHHAVKAATRSYAHAASITSSRFAVKSKMRGKQLRVTSSRVELTGPRPGVPYSTEDHELHKGKHRIVSPQKPLAMASDLLLTNTSAGLGLQINIDIKSIDPGKSVASARSRQSPSQSPSAIASSRQKPRPPGSAQHVKTIGFGEKEEEVKVEFAVQKSPLGKSSLPKIDRGSIPSRSSVRYPSFGVFGGNIPKEDGDGHEHEAFFNEDPLDQHFHAMPLSPGVKVQAGGDSTDGPEWPRFASRMNRSTFVRTEPYTLPTQTSDPLGQGSGHSNQVQKGIFLTETALEFSAALGRSHELGVDRCITLDDVSSAELTASFSCGSSTSLKLFRKPSKVQRPCRACMSPNAEFSRAESINFTNLVKQRAFHLKPPCLPTASSPSKRGSPRRVTSAPASSPLARRNLVVSKKVSQLSCRDLDRATPII